MFLTEVMQQEILSPFDHEQPKSERQGLFSICRAL